MSIFWIESEGIELFVNSGGSGECTLILLHEMGGSSNSWAAVAKRLCSKIKIVQYDQRGSGLSEKPRLPITIAQHVADLDAVINTINDKRPLYVAASAGSAVIALQYARHKKTELSGLILCSPALPSSTSDKRAQKEARKRAENVMSDGMSSIVDIAMKHMYPESIRSEAYSEYRARFLANDPVCFGHSNLAFSSAQIHLSAMDIPILYLAGELDIRTIEQAREMADKLAAIKFEIIKGAGHVMAVQAPELTSKFIDEFINNC